MTDTSTSAAESAPDACRACPWRTANHGKRHPDGWYRQSNRRRLWSGLRRGEPMSCHPTDPGNEVSDKAARAGYRPAPEGAVVRECVGATILVQREVMLWQDHTGQDLPAYLRNRRMGLTRHGLTAIVLRLAFGGVPLIGGRKMLAPNLGTPDISAGLPGLEWPPQESTAD